uniref:ribosomal protein L5 n=1 Tax=Haslea pseudostrearia TaxID=197756 RepID=UPI002203395F|nr:ribosomal protein L5 [Haslea pseudostrearia]UXN44193.1 ribosomal protein L5 [Haslea pseudostrearia]
MHFIKHYYNEIIKYDFINKFHYTNLNELPKLKKIILNFGCQNFTIQKFAIILLALELISAKKGSITLNKRANVFLKIQKGSPSGCQVILTKGMMYEFLSKLLVEIFPRIKNFSALKLRIIDHTFSYTFLSNMIILTELQEYYPIFNNLPVLNLTIITTAKNQEELLFLMKSFQFPFPE